MLNPQYSSLFYKILFPQTISMDLLRIKWIPKSYHFPTATWREPTWFETFGWFLLHLDLSVSPSLRCTLCGGCCVGGTLAVLPRRVTVTVIHLTVTSVLINTHVWLGYSRRQLLQLIHIYTTNRHKPRIKRNSGGLFEMSKGYIMCQMPVVDRCHLFQCLHG